MRNSSITKTIVKNSSSDNTYEENEEVLRSIGESARAHTSGANGHRLGTLADSAAAAERRNLIDSLSESVREVDFTRPVAQYTQSDETLAAIANRQEAEEILRHYTPYEYIWYGTAAALSLSLLYYVVKNSQGTTTNTTTVTTTTGGEDIVGGVDSIVSGIKKIVKKL